MGIFNLLGLGKEKNEIASFKYEEGLKNLENLDRFFLEGTRKNDLRKNNRRYYLFKIWNKNWKIRNRWHKINKLPRYCFYRYR